MATTKSSPFPLNHDGSVAHVECARDHHDEGPEASRGFVLDDPGMDHEGYRCAGCGLIQSEWNIQECLRTRTRVGIAAFRGES
jgi:endo-1,4-beta-mannosidase